MNTKNGLRRRLWRVYLLHAGLISVVALLSVFAAGYILQSVMIEQALRDETEHYWQHLAEDPAFPLPATRNLTGYRANGDTPVSLPDYLRPLAPGFHSLRLGNSERVVYVSQPGASRLYLVFDSERVNDLAIYFGLLPLAVLLVILYLAAWFCYRLAQQAVAPIVWLAREVNQLDPRLPDSRALAPASLPGDANEELRVLATAINGFAQRINSFVDRERDFTRDASHELRSPLTVIKMATELLRDDPQLSVTARQSVVRIERCVREMEELVELFLLLARESDDKLPRQRVCLNYIVEEQLERAQQLAGAKPIAVELQAATQLWVYGSAKVLSVLVGNLLRNAFSYTDMGTVKVDIGIDQSAGRLVIADSGVGIPEGELPRIFHPYVRGQSRPRDGHGVGLTIVKRLSDRFQWPVEIDSESGVGTTVTIVFPGAEVSHDLHAG